jgi:hypothetical protein
MAKSLEWVRRRGRNVPPAFERGARRLMNSPVLPKRTEAPFSYLRRKRAGSLSAKKQHLRFGPKKNRKALISMCFF